MSTTFAAPLLDGAGVAHAHVAAHVQYAVDASFIAHRAFVGLSGRRLKAFAPQLQERRRLRVESAIETLIIHRFHVGGGSCTGHGACQRRRGLSRGSGMRRGRGGCCSCRWEVHVLIPVYGRGVSGLRSGRGRRDVACLRREIHHQHGASTYGWFELNHLGKSRQLCGSVTVVAVLLLLLLLLLLQHRWRYRVALTLPRRRRRPFSQYPDSLCTTIDIEERPQLETLVHVHHHVRWPAVLAHLNFSEVRYREGYFVARLRTRCYVLRDYPVLRTIQ